MNERDELQRIDNNVYRQLMDFQRATVDWVEKFYNRGQKRILIADEVGLGKTFVARGVISKRALSLHNQGKRNMKVVYICSNHTIANQNISKLAIGDYRNNHNIYSSRLSMQHFNIMKMNKNADDSDGFIQLIPLTHSTSFNITGGSGILRERALIFAVLMQTGYFRNFETELDSIMVRGASRNNWTITRKKIFEELQEIIVEELEEGGKKYFDLLREEVGRSLNAPLPDNASSTLYKYINNILLKYRYIPEEVESKDINYLIGRLRHIFSRISLKMLEPDLVIMDEFQKFRYLLNADPETDIGMLTERFLNDNEARILLLSATPHRPYSTLKERCGLSGHVDQFGEFITLVEYLCGNDSTRKQFKTLWKDYCYVLLELEHRDLKELIIRKNDAENALLELICRTERNSLIEHNSIIDGNKAVESVDVSSADIESYLILQRIIDNIKGIGILPPDYAKSSPYLLSFLDGYKIKDFIEKNCKLDKKFVKTLKNRNLWIDNGDINNYKAISSKNAKLDFLKERVFDKELAKYLLWIPPSYPYYQPDGPFKKVRNYSKTLVFSSWRMVPRMISSLISYDAERDVVSKLLNKHQNILTEKNRYYFSDSSTRYPRPRLNMKEGISGMALFTLLYPSSYLAGLFKPIEILKSRPRLTLEQLRNQIIKQIENDISKLQEGRSSRVDKRWYYIAPVILEKDKNHFESWIKACRTLNTDIDEFENNTPDLADSPKSQFLSGIEDFKNQLDGYHSGNIILGRKPKDLGRVLTNAALASPSVCAFRMNDGDSRQATEFAVAFKNRMNSQIPISIVELTKHKNKSKRENKEAHWKYLLNYCAQGNFQAMLDEYRHMVTGGGEWSEASHQTMLRALSLRSALTYVDTFDAMKSRIEDFAEKIDGVKIRTGYAVEFDNSRDKGGESNRPDDVRNAFNSPFRPFVLATTSIGQEGLDLHYYCRNVMHWNLPSNPVDLEQREGRINRYQGHVIRQNIAYEFGDTEFESNGETVWNQLFQAAKIKRTDETSDLVPNWCLPGELDIKIERIVALYPFSKDKNKYLELEKLLGLYRLAYGQPNQEELLCKLIEYLGDTNVRNLFINLCPYFNHRAGKPSSN